jgi:hypothetical protein
LTRDEEAAAEANRLVVIFGASDDLCELRGAIHDEMGAYQEAMLFIDKHGNLLRELEEDDAKVLAKYDLVGVLLRRHEEAVKVNAFWCRGEYSWDYDCTAPHATFDILEDGEKYCRGLVIDLKECGESA